MIKHCIKSFKLETSTKVNFEENVTEMNSFGFYTNIPK